MYSFIFSAFQSFVSIGGRYFMVIGAGRTLKLPFLQAKCVPVKIIGTIGSRVCSAMWMKPWSKLTNISIDAGISFSICPTKLRDIYVYTFLNGRSLPDLDRVPSGKMISERLLSMTARAAWVQEIEVSLYNSIQVGCQRTLLISEFNLFQWFDCCSRVGAIDTEMVGQHIELTKEWIPNNLEQRSILSALNEA